jgi:pyrroline-5-carboxylate reductase
MALEAVRTRGLVLLGCGKMGTALLEGWLATGLPVASFTVIEPNPSPRLQALADAGLRLNQPLPATTSVAVIAVKPQSMGAALPALRALGNGKTMFLSIAAGTTLAALARDLGAASAIVRAMPNTPAAIGHGISAIVGNRHAGSGDLALAEVLLGTVGACVRLESEAQMDAVTALSGSGPAYVFHLIECMATAGERLGLPPDMAMQLARATVAGAGELAGRSVEAPARLRTDVTSPGGTTAAALKVLMDAETGFPALLDRAMQAAADRSRELAKASGG